MKRLIWLILLVVAPWLTLGGFFPGGWNGIAQASEVQVDATSIEYDIENKIYLYEDAKLTYGTLSVNARHIEVNLQANYFKASGQVRFRDNFITGSADRIEINLNDNTGTIYNAQLFDTKNGYYIKAEKILRSGPERYHAFQCSISTCSPKKGGWSLYSGELDYRVDNFASSTNSLLKLGPVPVFYFPWIAWPTVRQRRSGFLIPRISVENSSLTRFNLGLRLRTPFFWALDTDHDLTLLPDNIQKRGLGLGLEYNYAFLEGQTGIIKYFGIKEKYTRNSNNENRMSEEIPINMEFRPSRQKLDWGHNQGLGESTRMTWMLNRSSDGQIRREYFQKKLYKPQKDYEVTLSSQELPGNFSISTSHKSQYLSESIFANNETYSDGKYRPRLYPSLIYNIGGRPFNASSLALEFSGRSIDFETNESISGNVKEIQPSLSLPISLGGSWELLPTITRRFVQYDDLTWRKPTGPVEKLEQQKYSQDEIDLELRSSFARIFPGNTPESPLLKHQITPRLIYKIVEDDAQPLAGSFNFNDFNALSTPNSTEPDPKAGVINPRFTQKMVTLRLDNTWIKGNKKNAKEVANFNIIQRYNLMMKNYKLLSEEEILNGAEQYTPAGPVPILADLETEPGFIALPAIIEWNLLGKNLGSGIYIRYHHQLEKIVQKQISISGKLPSRGRLSFTYHANDIQYRTPDDKLNPIVASLQFDGSMNINNEVSMGILGLINLKDATPTLERRLEKGGISIRYNPGCYFIELSYTEALSITEIDNTKQPFVEKTLVLKFDLGGLFTGRAISRYGEESIP